MTPAAVLVFHVAARKRLVTSGIFQRRRVTLVCRIRVLDAVVLVQDPQVNATDLPALDLEGRHALNEKQGVRAKYRLFLLGTRRKVRDASRPPEALRHTHHEQSRSNFVCDARLGKPQLGGRGQEPWHAQFCTDRRQTQGIAKSNAAVKHTTGVMLLIDEVVHIHDDAHQALEDVGGVLRQRTVQGSVKRLSLEEVHWFPASPLGEVGLDELVVVDTGYTLRVLKQSEQHSSSLARFVRRTHRHRSPQVAKLEV
mmetsp:Transcript_29116/g.81835  ORF Transcript_29116/g.81835 Transcript_29116/m.81835 type:complete len:254 (-) Transcript_29116:547-1308(-)